METSQLGTAAAEAVPAVVATEVASAAVAVLLMGAWQRPLRWQGTLRTLAQGQGAQGPQIWQQGQRGTEQGGQEPQVWQQGQGAHGPQGQGVQEQKVQRPQVQRQGQQAAQRLRRQVV